MGFREPIDLSGFIKSSPELTEVLGGGGARIMASSPSSVLFHPRLEDYGELVLYKHPALGCSGVLSRSTNTDLESWPSVVWDVNGYYHALGVGFRASKKQLAEGYRSKGGPDDARLTYYFQQLLDPEIRRAYDAMPLGSVFMDRYVEDEIRMKAHGLAAQLRSQGMDISPEDILLDMGFVPEKDVELPNESGEVDTSAKDEQTEGAVEEREQDTEPEPWPYAYYLWSVKAKDSRDDDIEQMARWQDLIAQECARRGLRTAFAVGIMGEQREGSRVATMSVDDVTVAFIEQSAVDQMDQLAELVVQRLTN